MFTEKLKVSLDDKYLLKKGFAFMTGIQALVRLPLVQRSLDIRSGYNTAGYISGYRGSPLGAYDQQLLLNQKLLEENHIKFQPGVNEDLAATALWGTQQAELRGEGKYDGIFGIWYGKGPGIDRSGDVLRHANFAGTSKFGGVLAIMGDDHTCESSTTCHQSELAMVDAMIPILNPSGVQEIIDYGIIGLSLSRYSGCWIGLKCVHDTVESSASINVDIDRINVEIPQNKNIPTDGLNIRFPDTPQDQEKRMHEFKIDSVRTFCRKNKLDKIIWNGSKAKIGIISLGKSYLDTRLALDELGINEGNVENYCLRLYKVAMPWPLENQGLLEFVKGLELVIVVEEKRALIENQIKEILFDNKINLTVIGKKDENGNHLFVSSGALDTNQIAVSIGKRILNIKNNIDLKTRLLEIESRLIPLKLSKKVLQRSPYFCSGCPHNTSTVVPEGSIAMAGIGCHYMVQWMDRKTTGYTHMGGEGSNWIGQEPFSTRKHIFQNMGDGTYYHSGIMAIRAAVSANTNITFKILFNDAVAMTGGQGFDGYLSVEIISQQVLAEGVKKVNIVSDNPDLILKNFELSKDVNVYDRKELDSVQRDMRDIEGVSVLIYDQVCAAEKRRRIKRGLKKAPERRIFINDEVCEGCGDCGLKSNCVSILPFETEFGRKRFIDQYACNTDYTCVDGLCPSFVSVLGGRIKKDESLIKNKDDWGVLPEPKPYKLTSTYNIVLSGVGGTGIITISALLGMAAHIEKKGVGIIDMIGLSQKGGAVLSHMRIGKTSNDIFSPRIASQGADLILGCDLLVTGSEKTLPLIKPGHTKIIVNSYELFTGDFTKNSDLLFPSLEIKKNIIDLAGKRQIEFINATQLTNFIVGDTIATNIFLLGFAFQKGFVPLSSSSIKKSIEINGVSVEANKMAFKWGRRTAFDFDKVRRLLPFDLNNFYNPKNELNLDKTIQKRFEILKNYQNKKYAQRYLNLVKRVRVLENVRIPGSEDLTKAVSHNFFKLLAYKDEYEVSRLYSNGDFLKKINKLFEGDFRLEFHLAPPLFSRRDSKTGEPIKNNYGQWILIFLRILSSFKFLRGTIFDPFGMTVERKMERQLIKDYEKTVEILLNDLIEKNHKLAIDIAKIPEKISGFDDVKRRSHKSAKLKEIKLLDEFYESKQTFNKNP